MRAQLGRWSIRARLTLWYTAALACVLAAYAGVVFVFLRQSLYADLDRRLGDDIELIHESLEATDDGRLVWRVAGHSGGADESERPGHRWLEVWSREGQLLLRTASDQPLGLGTPAPGPELEPLSLERGGQRLRVLTGLGEVAGVPVLVRAARSEEPLRHELRQVLFVQGVALPVALALASFGGYQLARRVLRPVGRMAESARRISAERLGERLPVDNPSDELGHLAVVFNDAFARLERSFEQMRRFTADASHELRTPLTALRSVGEVGLQERPDDRMFADVVGSMLEEVDRLTRLVDTLLTLSRADAGQLRLAQEPVDLVALARDVASYLEDLAQEKGQSVEVDAAGTVEIRGDWLVLRQAVVNVVDNAIKYSPDAPPFGSASAETASGHGSPSSIRARASSPSIGTGSSSASTAWTRRDRGREEGRVWACRSRSGPSLPMEDASSWRARSHAAARSDSCFPKTGHRRPADVHFRDLSGSATGGRAYALLSGPMTARGRDVRRNHERLTEPRRWPDSRPCWRGCCALAPAEDRRARSSSTRPSTRCSRSPCSARSSASRGFA